MTITDIPELARTVGTAMAQQDWTTVLTSISPDVVAHVPAVGDLAGIDALAGFLLETTEKTDNGEHFELLDVLVGGEYVGLYFRITAERSGRPDLDNLTVHLAKLDGALISEIWFHNFDGQAVANFWA